MRSPWQENSAQHPVPMHLNFYFYFSKRLLTFTFKVEVTRDSCSGTSGWGVIFPSFFGLGGPLLVMIGHGVTSQTSFLQLVSECYEAISLTFSVFYFFVQLLFSSSHLLIFSLFWESTSFFLTKLFYGDGFYKMSKMVFYCWINTIKSLSNFYFYGF